jgi:hypothetical protein
VDKAGGVWSSGKARARGPWKKQAAGDTAALDAELSSCKRKARDSDGDVMEGPSSHPAPRFSPSPPTPGGAGPSQQRVFLRVPAARDHHARKRMRVLSEEESDGVWTSTASSASGMDWEVESP